MEILYLSPWFPTPPFNGSKIRINALISALAGQHEVHLISFVRSGEIVDLDDAKEFCASIQTVSWQEFSPYRLKALLGFFSKVPRSIVDTYSKEMEYNVSEAIERINPDLIVASELGTAPYVRRFSLPCIFDEIQVGVILDEWKQAKNNIQKWKRRLTWLKTRVYLADLLTVFNACVTASSREKELLQHIAPNYLNLYIIPNGVDTSALKPDLSTLHQSNTLIYNGALTYSANYDAMQFFLIDIFPLVKARIPATTLTITGSLNGANLSALPQDESVVFSGFLPDIRPAMKAAWACVVPLRWGGGTRLKILEAMALGTPVVSTSKGAEGLDVVHEENILIADTPDDFAFQTVRLLEDSELRSRLAQSGRKLVEQRYDWHTIGAKFVKLVEIVTKSHAQ